MFDEKNFGYRIFLLRYFFRNFFSDNELLLHKKSSFLLSIISQTYEARNHKINHLHEHERMLGKQISDYDEKIYVAKIERIELLNLKKEIRLETGG